MNNFDYTRACDIREALNAVNANNKALFIKLYGDNTDGDSKQLFSMFQGGSSSTASAGVGVVFAARSLKKKLLKKAKGIEGSPLKDADDEDVINRC